MYLDKQKSLQPASYTILTMFYITLIYAVNNKNKVLPHDISIFKMTLRKWVLTLILLKQLYG